MLGTGSGAGVVQLPATLGQYVSSSQLALKIERREERTLPVFPLVGGLAAKALARDQVRFESGNRDGVMARARHPRCPHCSGSPALRRPSMLRASCAL